MEGSGVAEGILTLARLNHNLPSDKYRGHVCWFSAGYRRRLWDPFPSFRLVFHLIQAKKGTQFPVGAGIHFAVALGGKITKKRPRMTCYLVKRAPHAL